MDQDAAQTLLELAIGGVVTLVSIGLAVRKAIQEDDSPVYAAAQVATGLGFLITAGLLGIELLRHGPAKLERAGVALAISVGLLAVTLLIRRTLKKRDLAARLERKAIARAEGAEERAEERAERARRAKGGEES